MYLWEKMVDYYQEKYLTEAELARQAEQLVERRERRMSRLAAMIGDRLIVWGLRLKGHYPRVEKVYSSHH